MTNRSLFHLFIFSLVIVSLPHVLIYFIHAHYEEQYPGNTIVKVTGSKQTGFEVTYRDGAGAGYPPLSNARKDCEKDDLCLTAVQVEYEWLSRMRESLRYAS